METVPDIPNDETLIGPVKIDDIGPKPTEKKKSSGRRTALKLRLQGAITGIGKAVAAFNEYDGNIVLANSGPLSDALDQWAQESPRVKEVLNGMLTVTTTGSVIGIAVAIIVPILANHGLIPFHMAETVGAEPVPNPERFFTEEEEADLIMPPDWVEAEAVE